MRHVAVLLVLATLAMSLVVARPNTEAEKPGEGSGAKKLIPATFNSTEKVKTRQLTTTATASVGLASGAANSPGMQSAALMQQFQSAMNTNPSGAIAELNAQNQETVALQVQNQQQAMLASIQTQQQQMAAAQAALAGQKPGQNGLMAGGVYSQSGANLQVQQQLLQQQQKLKIQQELLQQQQNPNAVGLSQQTILMAQLLNNPNAANQPQLAEQIRQQQVKQLLMQSKYPSSTLSNLSDLTAYSSMSAGISRNGLGGSPFQMNPLASLMSFYQPDFQQQLLLRQLLLRQQMAVMSSYGY